jgi:hypothetical protein
MIMLYQVAAVCMIGCIHLLCWHKLWAINVGVKWMLGGRVGGTIISVSGGTCGGVRSWIVHGSTASIVGGIVVETGAVCRTGFGACGLQLLAMTVSSLLSLLSLVSI